MKKIYFLMLVIAAMFASCSQSDELLLGGKDAKDVTFTLTADGVEQTRAAEALRYVMAIYDETETNVVLAETEFTTGSFSVRLNPGKYTCLFWADYGSENYDATNLKSVALKNDATNADAFFAKQGITVADGGTVSVTLHRTVAKVVLKETDQLEPGSVTMTYDGYKGFDVSAGNAINEASFTRTFTIANVIEASVESPYEVGSVLMLADVDERVLQDFKVQYNDEAEKTITNVPVQANYVTNINGKYSANVAQQFSVSMDDSWTTPDSEVDMIPYVTFSAASEQTFTMNFSPSGNQSFTLSDGEYFEYSVGNGGWIRFTSTVSDIPFGGTLGRLRLRGKSSKGTAIDYQYQCSRISFGTSGVLVDCKGDIRTLIDYENYETVSTADAKFAALFYDNSQLKTAPELPATTLSDYCYLGMFTLCTSLTKAPALPATTLKLWCYFAMFGNCTSLTEAPALPAMTLADSCYNSMFGGCTSLTEAPALPALSLSESCYKGMFYNCTSLTATPALPATTLANECYANMFEGCSSLTKASALNASTLDDKCYANMFKDCTSLSTAPALNATTLASKCCSYMFNGCTSLTKAPALNATTLAYRCYERMFMGCTSLTQAPELPATELTAGCYDCMFSDCSKLTKAPELKALTMKTHCYYGMFWGCSSLTEAPALPATKLDESCYLAMFEDCTSLTKAPELAAQELVTSCYSSMFKGCTNLSEVTMLATKNVNRVTIQSWLDGSGNNASSRTLTIANQDVYKNLCDAYCGLPDNWKQGATGTTVNLKN